jgi:hypothetical protein
MTAAYRLPRRVLYVLAAFVAIGLVTFSVGAAGAHPERAWSAFLMNLVYFFGLGLGGILLSAIQRIVGARWGLPVIRVQEALGAWLPIGLVLLIVFVFFGAPHLYPWIHEPIPAKAAWLDLGFMRARDIAVGVVLVGLAWVFTRTVLAPDLPGSAAGASDLVRRRGRLSTLSVVFVLCYAFGMTVLAWDLLMSLDPHWYSTMFPVILFWGPILNAVAWTILLTVLAGDRLGVGQYVGRATWHDLGKLLFAFGVFWAYINFAQLLVIWYGNLPEETGWLWERVSGPWRPVSVAVALCVWFVPFIGLLTRATKLNPRTLAIFAAIVAFGLWLERFYIVYPSVLKHAGGHGAGAAHAAETGAAGASSAAMVGQVAEAAHYVPVTFGLTEVGVTLGFLGLFLLAFFWFAGRYPIVAVRDYLAVRDSLAHH